MMIFLFTGVVFAALLWIIASFLPQVFHAPQEILDAVSGLGSMVGHVAYFVPVSDIVSAVGFVIGVYNFRVAYALFKWLIFIVRG